MSLRCEGRQASASRCDSECWSDIRKRVDDVAENGNGAAISEGEISCEREDVRSTDVISCPCVLHQKVVVAASTLGSERRLWLEKNCGVRPFQTIHTRSEAPSNSLFSFDSKSGEGLRNDCLPLGTRMSLGRISAWSWDRPLVNTWHSASPHLRMEWLCIPLVTPGGAVPAVPLPMDTCGDHAINE
jgi:hypothetical protein